MNKFLLVSAICGLLLGCRTDNSPPRFHSVIRMDRKAAERDAKARNERWQEFEKSHPKPTNAMAGGYSGYGVGLGALPSASGTTAGTAVGGGGVAGTGGLSTGVGTSAGTLGVGTTTPATSRGSTIGGSTTTTPLPGSAPGASSVGTGVGTGVSGVGTGLGTTTTGTGIGTVGSPIIVSPSPSVIPGPTGVATNTSRLFTNGVSPQP